VSVEEKLIAAARQLCAEVSRLRFKSPVTHVYNPLDYAWRAHELYLARFGKGGNVVFLGMNPGPFGMVQTGVPFGEISAVRDWMKIEARIEQPAHQHLKRPVQGFACPRSEVSGKRLWGLFAKRFGSAEDFFAGHFVANYCPLAFFDQGGRNLTPDKLPASQSAPLFKACDRHLRQVVDILQPEWLIGVGDFAEKRARKVFGELTANAPSAADRFPATIPASAATGIRGKAGAVSLRIGKILHPSPASPAANKDWAKQATEQLKSFGIWK
jgi:single-strand selective monofunctional uracil DNA glycosylase